MLFQTVIRRWNPRGLPRLAWLMRHRVLGRGQQIVSFQKRFRFLCDCESHYSALQAYGFINRPMDRVLQELLTVNPGEVQFFDIGANVGFVSLLACSLASHRVHAHCFEPNPMAAQRLRENVAMNSFDMKINAYALGDTVGKLIMTLGADSSNSTVVPGGFTEVGSVGTTEVQVRTLDEYCAEYSVTPTIAKLDVEGFEPRVLRGGKRTLTTKHPIIMVEVNSKALAAGGNAAHDLLAIFTSLGYQLYHIEPDRVGLSRAARQNRRHWQGHPEVLAQDVDEPRLFDVLAIPR